MKRNTAKRHNNGNNQSVVKVRLMGTKPDIESYSKVLDTSNDWRITSQSEILNLSNSEQYKRKYIEVQKNNDTEVK